MYYDLLPKIKNAIRARKESVLTPFSKMDLAVAQALVARGYLKSAEKRAIGKKHFLEVKLLFKDRESVITDFKVMSKPSRRLYAGYKELKPVKQGHGISILSTPQGIVTNRDARKAKVGGEYLFDIW
ncbi:MAG: 30S ribosomal protein S8 [bacterium]|nr:30S ribosomal protein S8 [bacterium]